jgi:hypothetical protein
MFKKLSLLLSIFLVLSIITTISSFAATTINDVFVDLNNAYLYYSYGDTWDPFWADDDNLYSFSCDGRGFGQSSRNICFNKLVGNSPQSLTGSLVNSMDEYGVSNEKKADNATWKACGQECIDGVFYCFVSRNVYGFESGDPSGRQTAFNSSLIKSTDRGLTWTRSAQTNYDSPMWPGARFATPFFVHYGKNGGIVTADNANTYVYAVSDNGFWNCGDNMILGRVLRSKLANLSATDWTYYTGGDGMLDSSWSSNMNSATLILNYPGQCSQAAITYIPALGAYVMVQWFNPLPMTWYNPGKNTYRYFQAAHPWGPWTVIKESDDGFSKLCAYGPMICSKFQTVGGTDVTVVLFNAGIPFTENPDALYKLWGAPVVLKTGTQPATVMVNDNASGVTYSGAWTYSGGRPYGDYNNDVHYSTTVGDYCQYTFNGTGIEYITEKYSDMGNVDLYLDNVFQKNINCYINGPRFRQVVMYSNYGLSNGSHSVKIVNKSTAYALVDAFRIVTGGTPAPTPTPMPTATPTPTPAFTWVNDDNPSMVYGSGTWGNDDNRPQEYNGDLHYTQTNNYYVQYTFTGTGVDWINEKANDLGNVGVYIDGSLDATVSCYNAARVHQQTLYSKRGLTRGSHTIKLVKNDAAWMSFDALKIYN